MFVRLAFAAAINVSPDILIIDEALAVGDAKFQQKCYKKFIEFQEEGKTILFVSHSADSIVRHCDHAVLLENGGVFMQGKPKDVINTYHEILFTGEPRVAKAGGGTGRRGTASRKTPPRNKRRKPRSKSSSRQSPAATNALTGGVTTRMNSGTATGRPS